jgi:hypothetical protein
MRACVFCYCQCKRTRDAVSMERNYEVYIRDLSCFCSKFVFFRKFIAGARGSVVVKALCYKPEGRGFDYYITFDDYIIIFLFVVLISVRG